ncbi:MAG TPA: hypothetical protein VFC02_09755 [Anaerolineales bacterium]|nr:hypothetical protein [Anaerolineales bacterium]
MNQQRLSAMVKTMHRVDALENQIKDIGSKIVPPPSKSDRFLASKGYGKAVDKIKLHDVYTKRLKDYSKRVKDIKVQLAREHASFQTHYNLADTAEEH